jgi:6-phosphogluconolactonase
MSREPIIDVAVGTEGLARNVVEWLGRINRFSRLFALRLAGGLTPRGLYALLARRDRIPWQRLHLFWRDERRVPPDHPDSNYGMVHATVNAHTPVPPLEVDAIPTSPSPEAAATPYEQTPRNCYRAGALDPGRGKLRWFLDRAASHTGGPDQSWLE